MPSAELFGLARRFTVARLLERDDFTQPDGRRRTRSRCSSSSTRSCRATTRSPSRPTSSSAEPSSGSTSCSAATCRASFGEEQQMIMTMPILPGTDGIRKMSKSLGNYVGVTEPAAEIFGKLMSVPDDAMPLYWELLLGETLDEARASERGKARLRQADLRSVRRLGDRGRGRGTASTSIHQDREIPADITDPPHRARRRRPPSRAPPRGLRRQRQRGAAADRPGRGPDRR